MNITSVSIQKKLENAKFGQCLYLGVPLCYEQKSTIRRTDCNHFLNCRADRSGELNNRDLKIGVYGKRLTSSTFIPIKSKS